MTYSRKVGGNVVGEINLATVTAIKPEKWHADFRMYSPTKEWVLGVRLGRKIKDYEESVEACGLDSPP